MVLRGEVSCIPGAGEGQAERGPHHPLSPDPFICPAQTVWPGSGLSEQQALSSPCGTPHPPLAHPRSAQRPPLLVSPHAVEGQWLEWGPWGPCSSSCANGTQQRSRKCSVAGPAWATCAGALTDTRECSNLDCPGEFLVRGLQVVALALEIGMASYASLFS